MMIWPLGTLVFTVSIISVADFSQVILPLFIELVGFKSSLSVSANRPSSQLQIYQLNHRIFAIMVPVTKSKYRRLSDLCLLALFGQMPLEDRLSAHKVCSRWGQLVREASRPVRSLTVAVMKWKKSLKYIEDCIINSSTIASAPSVQLLTKEDGCTPLYPLHHTTKWNCLQFDVEKLDLFTVQQILDVFFATTEFILVISNERKLKHLLKMLQDNRWRRQLTTFKLISQQWLGLYNNSLRISEKAVFKAINALSALRHLTIAISNDFTVQDLHILGQLKEIHFNCNDRMTNLVESLNRHATSNNDLQVYLGGFLEHNLSQLTAHLSDRIASLNNFNIFVLFFFNRFRFLKSLYINGRPSARLFTDLSELHQLVHLSLIMDFTYLPNDFDESVQPAAQLKSVKALDLDLTITSHSELQWLNLSWTVPNVQAIYLKRLKCESCDINNWTIYDDASKRDTARQCLCTVLQVFKQTGLPLCRILYRQPDDDIATAEELLTPT